MSLSAETDFPADTACNSAEQNAWAVLVGMLRQAD
jgi:hypothetical protein